MACYEGISQVVSTLNWSVWQDAFLQLHEDVLSKLQGFERPDSDPDRPIRSNWKTSNPEDKLVLAIMKNIFLFQLREIINALKCTYITRLKFI